MAKDLQLEVSRREKTGTSGAHKLRSEGRVPAVVYGHGTAPIPVSIERRALDELLHHGGRTGVVALTLDGKKGDTALVRQIQRHPVTHRIEHVDLQRVSANEAVHAKLPLVTVGTARGVKEFGGVLDVIVHEIDVEGPANQFPPQLEVDVTELGIHQHATASDVKLPSGFKLLTPPDTIVVSIEASKTAQHLEEAASGASAEQAQPEVIGAKPEGE